MLSTILRFIAASLLGAAEEKQVNYLAGKPEVRRPAAELRFTAFEHIENFEGLRLKAYKPTKNDVWTIGYGHTRTAREGMIITLEEAEMLLIEDLAWVHAALARLVKAPLFQREYNALASLVYNIGETQFAGSTLLKRLNAGDYKQAAAQFLVWNKQKNKQTGKLDKTGRSVSSVTISWQPKDDPASVKRELHSLIALAVAHVATGRLRPLL